MCVCVYVYVCVQLSRCVCMCSDRCATPETHPIHIHTPPTPPIAPNPSIPLSSQPPSLSLPPLRAKSPSPFHASVCSSLLSPSSHIPLTPAFHPLSRGPIDTGCPAVDAQALAMTHSSGQEWMEDGTTVGRRKSGLTTNARAVSATERWDKCV